MRGLSKFLFNLVLLAIFVGPPVAIVLSLQRYPAVTESDTHVFGDVKSAKALLARFDPRNMDPRRVTEVSVTQSELNSALTAGLLATPWIKARFEIGASELEFTATVTPNIPKNPIGQYLNLRASIPSSTKGFRVSRMSIGRLPLPAFLVKPVTVFILDKVVGKGKGKPIYESVRFVSISGDQVTVGLSPPAGIVQDLKDASKRTIQIADPDTVRAYYQKLVDVAAASGGRTQSFAAFIGPTFTLAKSRSTTRDAVTESRAAILALALYLGDWRIERVLGGVKTGALQNVSADIDRVKLENRTDWVQHFITSAGLMVAGGKTVADVLGEAKEVLDTDGPEGFSFCDLAADRTGVRLAQVATGSAEGARRVQNALAGQPREQVFFPHVGDLPEGLTEEEFKRRFVDVHSPAYTAIVNEIDKRIAAISLYR